MAADDPATSINQHRRYKPRVCTWCGGVYQPTSGRALRCDACRELAPQDAGRCRDCGSLVSGREKWGDTWGGECDRAEEITSRLMARLV